MKLFIQGMLVFCFIFFVAFFSQKNFSANESFKADIYSGNVSSILHTNIGCSTKESSLISLSGGSGKFSIKTSPADMGVFYYDDCKTQLEDLSNVIVRRVCFKAAEGVTGTGIITITDLNTQEKQEVLVTIGSPCVTDIKLCKSVNNLGTDNEECVLFSNSDLQMLVGEKKSIPYINVYLANGKTKVIDSTLDGIEFIVSEQNFNEPYNPNSIQGGSIKQIAGIVDNGVFYPSSVGNITVQATITNTNAYEQNVLYSDTLAFKVNGANCGTKYNDIFASKKAVIIDDIGKVPQPAMHDFVFTHSKEFTVSGQTIGKVQYDFKFKYSKEAENFDNEVATSSSKHIVIEYTGGTIEEQIDSLIRTYNRLEISERPFTIMKIDENTIRFISIENGKNEDGTGNEWYINGNPFNYDAENGTAGYESINESLRSFPNTMKEGSLLIAYYPGSDLHGFWTAYNNDLLTEDKGVIKIVPYARSSVTGLESQKLTDAELAYRKAKDNFTLAQQKKEAANIEMNTASLMPANEQKTLAVSVAQTKLETVNNEYVAAKTAYDQATELLLTTKDKAVEEQLSRSEQSQALKNYDSPFVIVHAQKQGKAVLAVQGFSCSTSKEITVLPGFSVNGHNSDFDIDVYRGSTIELKVDSSDNISWTSPSQPGSKNKISEDGRTYTYISSGFGEAKELIDEIRVTNLESGKQIIITIHIIPPKVQEAQILSTRNKNPIFEQAIPITKQAGEGKQSVTTFAIGKKALHGNTLGIDNCTIQFIDNVTEDFDCTDNSAAIDSEWNKTIADQVKSIARIINIKNYNISSDEVSHITLTHIGLPLEGNPTLNFEIFDPDNLINNSFEINQIGEASKAAEAKYTPNEEDFEIGDRVMLTINGKSISTFELSGPNFVSEILNKLDKNKNNFGQDILDSIKFDNTGTDLILSSKQDNKPFYATISVMKRSKIILRTGEAESLKLVAMMEDGSQEVWQAGDITSLIFGGLTWNIGDDSIAEITSSGQIIPKKPGFTTVNVVIGSKVQDEDGTHMTVSSTIFADVEVTAGFNINNIYDPERLKFEVIANEQLILTARDAESNLKDVSWTVVQNKSGASIANNSNASEYVYQAGVNSDKTGTIIDKIQAVDKLGNTYVVEIKVVPPSLQVFMLLRESYYDNAVINEGDILSDVLLNYQFSGYNTETVRIGVDPIPAKLEKLTWSSSDTAVASVENGIISALKEGIATISVFSSLNPNLITSLTITVEGRSAKFVSGTTKITPSFASVDAKLHIETEVYFKDGIKNIQEVNIRFASPYLPDAKLKLADVYNKEKADRVGIKGQEVVKEESSEGNAVEGSEYIEEGGEGIATDVGLRQARYVLDYQLPGEKSLEGKSIVYTLTAITSKGIRTDSDAGTTSISQAGVITIGSVQNICSSDKKLPCLLRGLKCLKQKESGFISEECDQVITVFTETPSEFSILDVFKKYKSLRK